MDFQYAGQFSIAHHIINILGQFGDLTEEENSTFSGCDITIALTFRLPNTDIINGTAVTNIFLFRSMLTELEIQQNLEQVKVAFPNLTKWEYNNEKNQEYFGFSIWGQFAVNSDELMPRLFYVTFDIYDNEWQGHLTVGQPCYLWSSADVGDAHLLETEACASLGEAIASLKVKIASFSQAFSATSNLLVE